MIFHDEVVRLEPGKRMWGRDKKLIEWVGRCSLETFWAECDGADWMMWLAEEKGVDTKLLAHANCDVARLYLNHVPEPEKAQILSVVEAVERWCAADCISGCELKDAAVAWARFWGFDKPLAPPTSTSPQFYANEAIFQAYKHAKWTVSERDKRVGPEAAEAVRKRIPVGVLTVPRHVDEAVQRANA